ncbi:transposase [Roseibium sp.]|uniref:transposase n=1 Tax=Roseibium sp. TaxID=1936156 RepID=UPI00262388E9|nr:transposase [Roseibium sp.]
MDLRERIVDYVAAGHSRRAAGRVFGVGASTAVRIVWEHRTCGDVSAKPQGRPAGQFGKLAPHMDFLSEIVRAEPDITLAELGNALGDTSGLRVQLSSIHRALVDPRRDEQIRLRDLFEIQLAPALSPGTVVILDNLSTLKSQRTAQTLKKRGCWFLFLPPHSPDLNPIEMAFAELKAHLRRFGARTCNTLIDAIADICSLFEPHESRNFLSAADLVSH